MLLRYAQQSDSLWAGQPAVKELIGQVACLLPEGELLLERPDGQWEAVYDPIVAEISKGDGCAAGSGGGHEFGDIHRPAEDGTAVMVPEVTSICIL